MMFIRPTNVLRIQEELKEYQRLCAEFKHSPAKEEFEDIVNFILTQSGSATGALSESISEKDMSYLFESFKEKSIEDFNVLKLLLKEQITLYEKTIVDTSHKVLAFIRECGLEFNDFSSSYLPKHFKNYQYSLKLA